MSYKDLHYFILKLLTKNYGLSDHEMALGVRVLGLEDKVYMYVFFDQALFIYTLPTFRWSKNGPLYFCFFPKCVEKLMKTYLLIKSITEEPLFMHHPVHISSTYLCTYYYSSVSDLNFGRNCLCYGSRRFFLSTALFRISDLWNFYLQLS